MGQNRANRDCRKDKKEPHSRIVFGLFHVKNREKKGGLDDLKETELGSTFSKKWLLKYSIWCRILWRLEL